MSKAKLMSYGNRLLVAGASVAGAIATTPAFADTDPFNVQGKIDLVASTTGSYFDIMLTSFWPFVLGATIIVLVVGLGYKLIKKLFGSN